MILDLREFDEFPARSTLRAEPGEIKPFADGVSAVGEVVLNLAIQHSAEEYFCQGEVSATYMLECSRCLAAFEQRVTQPTDFIVLCGERTATPAGKNEDDEEYVLIHGNDLRADVSEPLRQALVLSVPMKPLCSEGCRGLCPHCGMNLNERSCGCNRKTSDPRWEGLKTLTRRGEKE